MKSIGYRSSRLSRRVLTSCATAVALGVLFLAPSYAELLFPISFLSLLVSGIGHWLIVPPLFLFNAYSCYFHASRLSSGCPAVAVEDGELVLDHLWGRKHIPLSQLVRVYEHTLRCGFFTRNRWLAFQVQGGGALGYRTYHLPISVLEIDRYQIPRLIADIALLGDEEGRHADFPPAESHGMGFDADAAIERYLAKRKPDMERKAGDSNCFASDEAKLSQPYNPKPAQPSGLRFGRKGQT